MHAMRVNIALIEHLLEAGRLHLARKHIGEALQQEPDHMELLLCNARLLLAEGHAEEALRCAETVLVREPCNKDALHVLFHVQQALRRSQDAEETIIKLLRSFPECAHFYADYAYLILEHLQFGKAEALLKRAVRLDPAEERTRFVQCLFSFITAREHDLKENLARILTDNPEHFSASLVLTMRLDEKGRSAEALRIAQRLYRAKPEEKTLRDLVISLRTRSHVLLKPFYPLVRFGWSGSAICWAVGIVGSLVLIRLGMENAALYFVFCYLAWVILSWIVPPSVKLWIEKRGI